MKKILWCAALLFSGITFGQTTVMLTPSQDNSIFSENVGNSNGEGKLYAGRTCSLANRRALIQFDIASMVPAGATITSATLTLVSDNVSAGSGVDENSYNLHAVTTAWGEGTSSAGGTGATAVAPDATWNDAMVGTDVWATAGGDYIPAASATTGLTDVLGAHTWTSATMTADVQGWLDAPTTNNGWVLIGDEADDCSARRFGSKDDGVAPILEITYLTGCEPTAICQSLTVYLDADGLGVIDATDLDGGSMVMCDGGALSFSASVESVTCDDIFDGEAPTSLIISAVYDATLPGGLPKGIELYVVNDIADLSIYGIGSANNGGGTDGEEFTFPADAVSGGSYIYVASEAVEFENWFGFAPTYTSGSMSINGDDAIELFKDDAVIDVFGDIDIDGSGTDWDYVDGWAQRVSDTGPDGGLFTIGNWTFSGANALDGEVDNATAVTPIPVGVFTTAPTVGLPVTLTVTDEDLNSATCITAINVIDTLAPVMLCAGEMTFVLDETGSITIDPSDLDAGTTDGCGIPALAISTTTFTCAEIGENDVMLYATDSYGNMDSCVIVVTIDGADVISITEDALNDPTCFDFSDGSISVSIEGGTGDYSIDWDNDGTGDFDDLEDLNTLTAGAYEIVVVDDNGCEAVATFELNNPDPIVIATEVFNETCAGLMDGTIELTITGGAEPYSVFGDTEDLGAGTYTITVNDINGCAADVDVEVGVDVTIDNTINIVGGTLTANEEDAMYQWVTCPDYIAIDGATEQSYSPLEPGTYAVIITVDVCSDTSECFIAEPESVNENELAAIEIYPNPSNGVFNVQFENQNTIAELTVLDLKGTVLLNVYTTGNQLLDLTSVENGIYFIQIKTDAGTITKKVTISK